MKTLNWVNSIKSRMQWTGNGKLDTSVTQYLLSLIWSVDTTALFSMVTIQYIWAKTAKVADHQITRIAWAPTNLPGIAGDRLRRPSRCLLLPSPRQLISAALEAASSEASFLLSNSPLIAAFLRHRPQVVNLAGCGHWRCEWPRDVCITSWPNKRRSDWFVS